MILDPSLVEHNFWLTRKKDYGSSALENQIGIQHVKKVNDYVMNDQIKLFKL